MHYKLKKRYNESEKALIDNKQEILSRLERRESALISEIMGVNDNFSIENLGDHGSNSIGSDASQSHVLVQGFDADSFGNFSKTDVTLGDFNEQQNSCEWLDIQNQELCQESFFDSFEDLRNTSFNEMSNDKWCLDFYH